MRLQVDDGLINKNDAALRHSPCMPFSAGLVGTDIFKGTASAQAWRMAK
jgi:hypothetical protein